MSETKPNQRFHSLNAEQVEVLHQVLSDVVPIHGRGNFPTLELRPRDIIIAVRARLQKQGITVRDVRLNGSTASHVLVRDNGTSYKDLDIIFGVELPSQEEFQVIKESVLCCLLDCLPAGVNRERISSATMKEAYVQKMVKVFNEHDRWSLISLSNNSGKNLELKFVSALRRQFEFSVDSFQIILDRLLESYMQQESQHKQSSINVKNQCSDNLNKQPPSPLKQTTATETDKSSSRDLGIQISPAAQTDKGHEKESQTELSLQIEHSEQTKNSPEENNNEKTPTEVKETAENLSQADVRGKESPNLVSEKKQTSEEAEPPTQIQFRHNEPELLDMSKLLKMAEHSVQTGTCDGGQLAQSNQELSVLKEPSNHSKPPDEQDQLSEQMGAFEVPGTSNKTQTNLAEDSHSKGHSAKTDSLKYVGEEMEISERDETPQVSVADTDTTHHATADTHTSIDDETKTETETGEQLEAEMENDTDINEKTEDSLTSAAKHKTDTQSLDCSCSISSTCVTLQQHNMQAAGVQDAVENPSTPCQDETPSTPDTADAADTQDTSPALPSLVSNRKTSSAPSCKASERLSHMVVLKHSSPKPPRRMCRKVTPTSSPNSVSESEPVIAPSPDRILCPSPEPDAAFNPSVHTNPIAPITSESTLTTTTTIINESPHELPPDTSRTLVSESDLTCAPFISSSDVDPMSELTPQPPSSSDFTPGGPSEAGDQVLEDSAGPHEASDEVSESIYGETVSVSEQSEPLDSMDILVSEWSNTNLHESAHASEIELSDEDDNRTVHTKMLDLDQPNNSAQKTTPPSPQCVTPPVSCLTPPVLSFSPPCFTPSPPCLSPPPCLTPPSHGLSTPMLSTVSPTPSFSSPPLSFSPTSSCLSSPPYLTPPMLSLSPPPLCLSPPSPCLSPPLLCLTPPVESVDLVSQVSEDMGSLILNAGGEEQITESSPQPGVPLLQVEEDKKDHDFISSFPQVAEPVPFPITIPNSASHVLSDSESGDLGDSSPPKVDEASVSELENEEAPEVTADMPEQSSAPLASDSVPAVEVLAESMYGDFEAAMDHLRYRLIATRNPEEIRGGGLLKYSNLLVRDYRPASETQIKTLERYMCSRFFIDFPDVQEQQRKILSYLKNHFIGEERSKYQYLMTLRRVVDDSTVCLMGHERRQTLNMITVLALKVLGEQNIIPNTDHVTCFYQPAPYIAEHSAPYLTEPSYCSYYIPQGGSTLLYQPYPLHLHTQTGLV